MLNDPSSPAGRGGFSGRVENRVHGFERHGFELHGFELLHIESMGPFGGPWFGIAQGSKSGSAKIKLDGVNIVRLICVADHLRKLMATVFRCGRADAAGA
jgi:hypothetical protein